MNHQDLINTCVFEQFQGLLLSDQVQGSKQIKNMLDLTVKTLLKYPRPIGIMTNFAENSLILKYNS